MYIILYDKQTHDTIGVKRNVHSLKNVDIVSSL